MIRLIKAKEVDSTNDWIKRNISKLKDLDSLIADTQDSGKGRNSKNWFSPRGGLWMSVLIEKFPGNDGALSLLCATAVCEVLEDVIVPVDRYPGAWHFEGLSLDLLRSGHGDGKEGQGGEPGEPCERELSDAVVIGG